MEWLVHRPSRDSPSPYGDRRALKWSTFQPNVRLSLEVPMRTGELAGRAGVNPKTVRYYETIGVLPEPPRTSSGYRDYDDSYVGRLTFVRTAQRLGVTLDEVKEILGFRERGEVPCAYVRDVIDAQVTDIDRRIRELQELRGQLGELAEAADDLPPAAEGVTCQLIEHVRQKAAAQPEAQSTRQEPPSRAGQAVAPAI